MDYGVLNDHKAKENLSAYRNRRIFYIALQISSFIMGSKLLMF